MADALKNATDSIAVIPSAAALAAATAVGGLWLDSRFNIREDIAQIRSLRVQQRRFRKFAQLYGDSDWCFYHVLHSTVGQNETQEALLFEDRSWTYGELRGEVGRLALKFQEMGIQNRTVVGMYINNSPEFFFTWWALYKLGAIPAPVNTSITREPLKHCLRISSAEVLITTFELIDAVAQTFNGNTVDADINQRRFQTQIPDLPCLKGLIIYDHGTYHVSSPALSDVDRCALEHRLLPIRQNMADWPPESRPKIGITGAQQYVFTSGTTGLPKAILWPAGFGLMGPVADRYPYMWAKKRRFYCCTPLFHAGASFAAVPPTLWSSGTVILARKFSVSNFWKDIRRTRANAVFYIGEMARFLVQAPPDPHHQDEKRSHGVELMYGIGIAPPIWRALRERFGIRWIVEYYGSSEGTTILINSNRKNDRGMGKVAHWGPLMRWFGQDSFYIIKIDLETGDVYRDPKTGLCKECAFDEVGESIMRIRPPLQKIHEYVGTGGKQATEQKLLRDVFNQGDLFFRIGDALSMDREGYITFHDRLGDTYRAKGHNISTTEVEMAFLHHPYIKSVNVIGIPMNRYGYDGQLGYAAVTVINNELDDPAMLESIKNLEQWLVKEGGLPLYAVPRFIRIMDADSQSSGPRQLGARDDLGGEQVSLIMKKLKTGIRAEALNPQSIGRDKLFWIEREGAGFVELRPEMLEVLRTGQAKL